MSTPSLVQVIEENSNEVLFECAVADSEAAYEYAAKMDKMGISVKVVSPTITETLCDSLGIELDEREEYEQSVVAEIEDHDGSCCATPSTPGSDKLQ